MPREIIAVIIVTAIFGSFLLVMFIADLKTLNIKSKTVGDGQHGTARFATPKEISRTFSFVSYTPNQWRKNNPTDLPQGIVLGCNTALNKVTAIVDSGDVHALMIGAAGVGKTAKFLYPNLEYCCACGMSFVTTDTKATC